LRDELPEHQNIEIVPTSLRHNSTTMSPIQEAIEYIKSREAGDKSWYRQVAKEFGVDRAALSQRHQGKIWSYDEMAER
jgi:hypothetical protein